MKQMLNSGNYFIFLSKKQSSSDPQAEGAANLVRGISTYIDDHADIPVYLRTSTRTVAEEAVFQSYTHKNFPEGIFQVNFFQPKIQSTFEISSSTGSR
jgi:hypothetical protein